MSKVQRQTELHVPALEVRQNPAHLLYTFALDGKILTKIATVSRIHRSESSDIAGYQRPEVLSHIAEIRRYVESRNALLPNSIVVAFDRRVRFEPHDVQPIGPRYSRLGTLAIPMDADSANWERPGWIVDGQQRVAAIRDANVVSFPVPVTAFITDSEAEQREQFILVNSTKPLPKGLIYELLPATTATLSTTLHRKRFPAFLLDRLNRDPKSPLYGMIQMPTNPAGVVKDNSALRMIENSLTDGALFRARLGASGHAAAAPMLRILRNFWWAVADSFPDAWGHSPRRSRLMHGAGIVSMGFVMDAISERYRRSGSPTREQFTADLEPLRQSCAWTRGHWEFPSGVRKWNEIQNTSKDVQTLADHLLTQYKVRVWNQAVQHQRHADGVGKLHMGSARR